MPKLPPQPLVVVVVYNGLCTFEFSCAIEVFGLPRPEMGPNWYRCATAAAEPGRLRGAGGLLVRPDGGLALLARADTIIIPGWRAPDDKAPGGLLSALRRAHGRGCRIVSICGGAFVLAQSGLLDGRRATTHWHHIDKLAAAYPAITVDPRALYVEDGNILTSAGSAAGLDLCIHLVRSDYGSKAANSVARRLVVAAHRDGGQSQFVERPLPPPSGRRLSALLDEIRSRLGERWSVDRMASQAHVSVRSIQRHFQEATGLAPGAWLQRQRMSLARELLEETRLSVEVIGAHAGFGTPTNFRKLFRTAVGLSPAAYRSGFHVGAAGGKSDTRPR